MHTQKDHGEIWQARPIFFNWTPSRSIFSGAPWNTTRTSNGCHVLSAVAQDDAGNQGTASIPTLVNNP
jgi:hypothetical protein